MRRLLQEQKLEVRGKRVVLKPNLVEFEPGSVINTHPLLVHAAFEAFRALGAADVRIAEGPGHRRNTLDLADAAGYFGTIRNFEDVFTDLNLDEVSRVQIARPSSRLNALYLPQTVLSCDLLVSLPKNENPSLDGRDPGDEKSVRPGAGRSLRLAQERAALGRHSRMHCGPARPFPRHFTLVDGIVGMEGNGPIQGKPKPAGVLVAGRDMPAVDATCCRIMGIDPAQIGYLQMAGIPGEIHQTGRASGDGPYEFRVAPDVPATAAGIESIGHAAKVLASADQSGYL